MSFLKKNIGRSLFFSFYGAVPVLLTSLLSHFAETGILKPSFTPGIFFFAAIVFLVFIISSLVKRKYVLIVGIFCFMLYTISLFLVVKRLDSSYYYLVSNLYITSFITIAIILIQKHIPKQAIEQSSDFISLSLFLFASYYGVFHLFTLYLLFVNFSSVPATGIILEGYSIVNLVPFFFTIIKLKKESLRILSIDERYVSFQGRDISPHFSDLQRNILIFLTERTSISKNCRNISMYFPSPCREEGSCKPSVCLLYSNIYRQINEIRKKLNRLQIGNIVSPENKQMVRNSGWKIRLYSGVKIKANPSAKKREISNKPGNYGDTALIKALEVKSGLYLNKRNIRTIVPLTVFFSFFASLSIGSELINSSYYTLYYPIIYIVLFGLYFIPTLFRTKNNFIQATILSLLITVIIIIVSIGPIDEEHAIFMAIKNFTIFLAVFLLKYNSFEANGISIIPKESVFRAVFWILWFYLAGILVFRSFYFPFYRTSENLLIIETISDSTVLAAVLLTSFWFLRHQNRVLIVRNNNIHFTGKNIEDSFSLINLKIFRFFIKAPEGRLTCSDLVFHLYPKEADICKRPCKPSLCPLYQRIYKRVREIRKIVELLEIGTVLSPDRNSDVKKEGWKLLVYNDIDIK